jgi:hypothetical protein
MRRRRRRREKRKRGGALLALDIPLYYTLYTHTKHS